MEIWDIYDENKRLTGRTTIRGDNLEKGEYHLVVFGIVKNAKDEFLLSKRSPEKTFANTWEVTGGSATAGESSYDAVKRELEEEIGLVVQSVGHLIQTYRIESECSHFADVWLFEQEFQLDDLRCQPGEVSEIQVATKDKIMALYEQGLFMAGIPRVVEYFENLL
ncbi:MULTISPECIES: NUDIX domain-containing protein [unclassified Fusibacter]|uniref:NUDIX hydrolase n=1 Tax=unclassified Fusibacter TaxID=2624464 RepID=UPI0010115102|nr:MULTISPECIES: NUDIX domain-containing protein [unclassified Fusibacter]MCK8059247.1 NUDIX domain-containing protein [Fusibacter sp. A2]NPE21289.1 NUDIX domain-containing protein [Fusibacter sp. A1]RXV62554.1 NUDIX domain-containing protein [Fusibacter sp. A1]